MKLFIICLVVLQIILADCRDRRAFPHHIETGILRNIQERPYS
jgi:hypothetical protein